jgi:heme-degrading monooxygenase HmoA
MAFILIQHTVKDYEQWRRGFDAAKDLRASGGEISTQIFRDVTDANKLTIINKWDSLANAQKFVASPELREAMEKAGVVGAPTVVFLNEA